MYDKLHEITGAHVAEGMTIIMNEGGALIEYVVSDEPMEIGYKSYKFRARQIVNAELGKLGEEVEIRTTEFGPVIYVARLSTGWRQIF